MTTDFKEFPSHYSFPPFFTLQPNKETQTKQLSIWIKLIQGYCEKTRQFTLDKGHPIFSNKEISRSLSSDGIAVLFDEMVKTSQAEFIDATAKDSVFVWWNSKDTWAKKLLAYAEKNGLLNSVATIYELLNDNEEFQGMDEPMLVRILKVLESSSKCELMTGGAGTVEGVKFFM